MDQGILKQMIACYGGRRRKSVQTPNDTSLFGKMFGYGCQRKHTYSASRLHFQTFVFFRSKSALRSFEVHAVMSATYLPSTASVSDVCRPSAAIVFNILVLLSSRRFKLIRKIWTFR